MEQEQAPPATVIIADSHEIVREGIAMRLKQVCEVDTVADASDGYTLLKLARQHNPDIVVMDFQITRPSGVETLDKLRTACPDTRVIVLSSDASTANAFYVLAQGAVGFMPKQAKGEDFAYAVTAALSGYAYLPIELLKEFVKSRRNLTRTGNVFGLSPREIEILEATINGMSTKDVAQSFGISVRTVETHRNSIYKKTSCRNHEDLASMVSFG